MKWHHSAILKVWRHIENPTPSVDAYLLEEQNMNNRAKFHPYPIWNDRVLGILYQVKDRSAQQEQEQDE